LLPRSIYRNSQETTRHEGATLERVSFGIGPLAINSNSDAFPVAAIVLVLAILPSGAAALTPTTTALVSTPNPATLGQAVTLTATVSSAAASGRVTFYDGVIVLGIGKVSGGRATLSTTLLPSGNRLLKAYYRGDASFAAGASPVLAQTVVALPQSGFKPAVNINIPALFSVGSSPQSVAIGDFNGDGKADLAVANFYGTVSVLLGNGDGTFQAAVNYNVAGNPQSLAVADFDDNGTADLAVANGVGNNVSVLLGNGDGTFQSAVSYNVASDLRSLAVGDFNGDGKADLAVASYASGVVSVLLGNGDGTFQTRVNYNVGGNLYSVTVGDFNGDGRADLVVGHLNSNSVSVLLGQGDGTFKTAVNYNAGTDPLAVAVGDVNGDGNADLVVANTGGSVTVLLGNGDGTFRAAVNYNGGINPVFVGIGDFNGDGKADIAVANQSTGSNNVSVLLGNGDGTFQSAVKYTAGGGPVSLAVGDFSGDGVSDLAVANIDSNNVSILLGVPVAPSPVINAGGVVAGANYTAPIAPGLIATIFGANLSSANAFANGVPLPTALGGVSVRANGVLVPLFFASPAQINFQVPWELLGQTQVSVVATVGGSSSAPQIASLLAVAPGIFSTNSSGAGQGAIQISNTTIFAAPANSIQGALARPAQRGEFLTIYCSGLGDVSPRPATGAPASGNPLSNTLLTPSVTIGGISAPVSFAGLSPGFVGLYQVNVQVPNAAPTGGQVPVVMAIGGVGSNTVTIAVQ